MVHVKKTKLPLRSKLHKRVAETDFLDCYKVRSSLSAPQAAEVIVAFPAWAAALVTLRNILTSPFKLKKEGPEAERKFGIFPVEHADDAEVIVGFNDRHLDFRVCVFATEGEIYLSTWVHPHHIGGRAYLAAIMPFHILIVRNALARVARQDQNGTTMPLTQ